MQTTVRTNGARAERAGGKAILKSALLGTAVFFALSNAAFSQDAPPPHKHHHRDMTSNDRLDLLEKQVEMQSQQMAQQAQEISALKAQLNQAPVGEQQQPSQVSSAQFEALQNQVYETQATVNAAAKPKDKKLHFHGVTVTLGGFAAAESVWRSNSEESDIGSSYAKIPFAGPGTAGSGNGNAVSIGHMGEFRMTARQSRISGLAEADVDPNTHLAFYGEFDFLGAAASANSNESNSYTPRVRNLYGAVDWSDIGLKLLFGQSWSLATLDGKGMSERTEMAPPTIDAQYVPGFDWTRQPQLRLVKSLGDTAWIGVSLENPQTTVGGTAPSGLVDLTVNNGNSFSTAGANGTADAEFNPGIQLSLNHVPDIVAKVAVEPAIFGGNVHLEAFGLYRDFYDRFGTSLATVANHDVTAGGGGFGAVIKVIPGLFDLQADGMFGDGIGRYGSGQLSDATYAASGLLKPLPEDMEMLGGTLHATPDLDIYVYGGREHEDARYFNSPNAGGYGNPGVTDTGCANFNLTTGCAAGSNLEDVEQLTMGLWDTPYDGDWGKFKIGVQYSYTYLKAEPGIVNTPATLGQPHTSDNMLFTSVRYYPF